MRVLKALNWGLMLLCSCVVWGQGEEGQQAPQSDTHSVSRFVRTIVYLQGAAPEPRALFARVALEELSAAHAMEVEIAVEEAQKPGGDRALLAWASSVDSYGRQFAVLLEDLDIGFPVYLSISAGMPVALTIADRTVILTHPRVSGQAAYEQSVLVDFCSQLSCEQMTPDTSGGEPLRVFSKNVRPSWGFTVDGPVCSHSGVNLIFPKGVGLAGARGLCKAIFEEVESLANQIVWQVRHAVSVDWEKLVVHRIPGGTNHRVQLNPAGDSVLAALPILYGDPLIFRAFVPWFTAKAKGEKGPQIDIEVATIVAR
jgi:hypothetical protein